MAPVVVPVSARLCPLIPAKELPNRAGTVGLGPWLHHREAFSPQAASQCPGWGLRAAPAGLVAQGIAASLEGGSKGIYLLEQGGGTAST